LGAEAATWVGSHICFYRPWTTSSGMAGKLPAQSTPAENGFSRQRGQE
jgi:hypothetical protein